MKEAINFSFVLVHTMVGHILEEMEGSSKLSSTQVDRATLDLCPLDKTKTPKSTIAVCTQGFAAVI